MIDTARVLLIAAILPAIGLSSFAWRITRLDPMQPERLIGELRLAQWCAMLLSAVGAIPIGLAIAKMPAATANLDVALGVIFVGLAGIVLQRDPRDALLLVSGAFVLHALADIAHRPDWLTPDLAPRWYTVGCATYNTYMAALCYWARRR